MTQRGTPGFSLLELMIAMAIGFPVLVAAMAFFHGQSNTYSRGEQHMEAARETALVTRVLYSELKEIHAPMTLDERYDLGLAGESNGRLLPNRIVLEPGRRSIRYWAYPLDHPGERVEKRLSLSGSSLLVRTGAEEHRIGRHLTTLAFAPVSGDPSAVRVRFALEIPSRPGIPPSTDAVDLIVRLEGELNVVR